MHQCRYICKVIALLLSMLIIGTFTHADSSKKSSSLKVPRIKQIKNYCGPACVAAVMQYYGRNVSQEEVGREVYDPDTRAAHGADMLLYARNAGFAAYSWNASIEDVKKKLSAGLPVIALQQNSQADISGHYRVITGYDEKNDCFAIMDPYYDYIAQLSSAEMKKLWQRMGYWALLIVPRNKDVFEEELGRRNSVVHMDLSYAYFKRNQYDEAAREANLALSIEPDNSFAIYMRDKVQQALAAGPK